MIKQFNFSLISSYHRKEKTSTRTLADSIEEILYTKTKIEKQTKEERKQKEVGNNKLKTLVLVLHACSIA